MRIVAGKYRGKKLITPENMDVRPTSDRARESIFNILYSKFGDLQGKKVLDVFAGTGALGFEALSRGATKVCFIDKDVKLVRRNMALFSAEKDNINILCADACRLPKAKDGYDFIFSDAPYDKGLNEKALMCLAQNGFILPEAVCVVETRRNENLNLPDKFEAFDERVYGMAKIWFFVFHP